MFFVLDELKRYTNEGTGQGYSAPDLRAVFDKSKQLEHPPLVRDPLCITPAHHQNDASMT
eukprot:2273935-Rhodomonas_salina.6